MNIKELFDLTGKVAVITGGARHLGFEMADGLAEAGADLILTSRDLASAQASDEKLKAMHGHDAVGMELDVTNPEAIAKFAETAEKWKGRIDILINNAGGGSGKSPALLFERGVQDMQTLINTNLMGALYCSQAIARIMAKRKSGKIINIASMAGFIGRDRRMYERNGLKGQPIDYAASKAGIIGMTIDMAAYLAPMGIYVNSISPGGFERPDMKPGFVKDYSDRTPLGHMGRDGRDLKGAALFLAAPASDYVVGHNLVVDGGFSIWH